MRGFLYTASLTHIMFFSVMNLLHGLQWTAVRTACQLFMEVRIRFSKDETWKQIAVPPGETALLSASIWRKHNMRKNIKACADTHFSQQYMLSDKHFVLPLCAFIFFLPVTHFPVLLIALSRRFFSLIR